ncbi:MAG: acetolactate synthase-1/2/3 large subunit [Porticoccus sp.]|jgi:acetolactate synthase-1/2/3 large subunit
MVTHELSAAFIADAMSLTTSTTGTLVVVPGAGITHAASGIGEAFLGGIPLLIIAGGIDRQSVRHFQLKDIDHHALLAPTTERIGHRHCFQHASLCRKTRSFR